jgi:hypothetical protein
MVMKSTEWNSHQKQNPNSNGGHRESARLNAKPLHLGRLVSTLQEHSIACDYLVGMMSSPYLWPMMDRSYYGYM